MNKRTFKKVIRSITRGDNNLLSLGKIAELPDEIKEEMVYFIVRNRQPIVKELIPLDFDFSWLRCMGYLYETKGKYFTFVHTSEQRVK